MLLNKKFFSFLFFAFCALFPLGSDASTLTISPATGSYAVNSTFSIAILLDTAGAPVSGVDIRDLNYNSTVLRANSVTPGSLFSQTTVNTITSATGKINFQQVSGLGGTYTGSGTLATVSFTALATGVANLSFDHTNGATNDTNVAGSGTMVGTDTLTSATGGTITVGAPSDTTAPTVSVSAPSTATVNTAITLSATASDNIGVSGVQFKVNNVNQGSEDTASPYSLSWTPSTTGTYTITATARDAAGNQTTSSGVSVVVSLPADTTAPTISLITTGSVTTAGATITWTTDELSNSFVDYGITSSYGSTATNASLVTSHTINLSSLSPNTTYNYRVRSADAAGNSATSLNRTFTTQSLPDTQAPNTITNFSASNVGQNSMVLSWTAPADLPSGNTALYDIRYSTSPLNSTTWASATQATGEPPPANAGTNQNYTLAGLTSGTTYYIGIKSQDSQATPNISAISNIVTQQTQAAVVAFNFSVAGPSSLSVVQTQNITGQVSATTLAGTPALVSFSATNLPSGATAQFSPSSCTPSTACTSTMTLTTQPSVVPGTYTITITGTSAGVAARSTTATFTILALPSAPVVNLLVNGATSAAVTSGSTAILSWTTTSSGGSCSASGDWNGSKAVLGSETTSAITSAKSYTLTCTDQYQRQGQSSVSVTLQGTAPAPTPVISNVSVTNITATGATVTWTTDIPTGTQVDYGTTASYGNQSTLISTFSTSHSATLSGLSRKTTYHIRARGASAQGVQTSSSDSTFTTSARLSKPPKVQNVSASLGSVILNWTNPQGYEFFAGTAILKQTGGYATEYSSALEIARTGATTYTDTNVSPGTTYYYSLFAYDDQGVYADPENVVITTPPQGGTQTGTGAGTGGNIPPPDTTPPATPDAFLVLGIPDGIYLQWKNPTNSDYVRTVVVRKEGSTPTSRTDGTTIYEGTGTQYTDTGAVSGRTYYYALFAFDTSSNYSPAVGGSTSRGALTEAQAQAQLATLSTQAQTTTPACNTVTGSGLTLSQALSRGAKSGDVLLLQRYLNANGFVIASSGVGSPGNESDYFGALTETAVKKFQCARGIICSGEGYGNVGPRTRAELAKGGAPSSCAVTQTPTTTTVTPPSGSVKITITRPLYLNVSGEDVRSLQKFLNANGFVITGSGAGSPGNETTFFGQKTEDAVKRYQCARGIICSGYGYGSVGPKTRSVLNAE